MDRRAQWATVYGVTRVRQDLATKPSPPVFHYMTIPHLFTYSRLECLGCFNFWIIMNNTAILELISSFDVKIESINLDYVNLSHSPSNFLTCKI